MVEKKANESDLYDKICDRIRKKYDAEKERKKRADEMLRTWEKESELDRRFGRIQKK